MSFSWSSNKFKMTLLLVLAGVVGLAGFILSRYETATLVLEVRTFEKGAGRVELLDVRGRKTVQNFAIGDDRGEASYYPVELPRVLPATLHIAPLGSKGSFAIDRITLRIGSLHYSWDPQKGCSSRTLRSGVIARAPCLGGVPTYTIEDDLSLTISQIPADGFVHGGAFRSGVALLLFTSVMLGGAWLMRKVPETGRRDLLIFYGSRGCWLIVVAVYLLQLSAIWRYSVDVPFWEEWDYFIPEALPSGLTWKWLFSFTGYHRVVPTKFMAWMNYRLLGLDFTVLKLINYFIFGGLLLSVSRLKHAIVGSREFLLFPAFLIFMLSPIAFENHSNSYQSQIHLVLICAIVALQYAFSRQMTLSAMLLFSCCMLCAINTFSAGMTIAAGYFLCWALYLFMQIAREQVQLRKGIAYLVLHVAVVGAGATSWILGNREPADFKWVYPDSRLFWETFLNLLSFGFGYEGELLMPGVICLLVVLCPVVMLLWNPESRRQRCVWQLVTGILGILAIFATISITRGIFAGTATLSRYAEFGLLLIPLISLAWWLALKQVMLRRVVLGVIWTGCFLLFQNNWSFAPYRDVQQMSFFVIECLEEYVAGKGNGVSSWSHYKPLGPSFDKARELDVKFTRQFGGAPQSRSISSNQLAR